MKNMQSLDERRINIAIECFQTEKFALEACHLAEEARALAREIKQKQALYMAQKRLQESSRQNPVLRKIFSTPPLQLYDERDHSQ